MPGGRTAKPPLALDPDTRERLLQAFRKDPPQQRHNQSPDTSAFTRAGHAVKLPSHRARHAWVYGWPAQSQPPMRETILREQAGSRFLRARMDMTAQLADVYEAASKDAAEQLTTDGVAIRLLNGMVDSVVSEFATSAAVIIRRSLQVLVQEPPKTAAEALNQITAVTRGAAQVAAMKAEAVRTERLVAGEPTEIIDLAVPKPTTLDEIEEEIRAAQRALEYAREEARVPRAPKLPHGASNGVPKN